MTTARTQPAHMAGTCYRCGREVMTGAYRWLKDERGRKRMSCADQARCEERRARYPTIADRRRALVTELVTKEAEA